MLETIPDTEMEASQSEAYTEDQELKKAREALNQRVLEAGNMLRDYVAFLEQKFGLNFYVVPAKGFQVGFAPSEEERAALFSQPAPLDNQPAPLDNQSAPLDIEG